MTIQQMLLAGVAVAGPAAWNPSDKSSDVTLSNANTTGARGAAAAAWRCVRSVVSRSTGKYYFEITNDVSIGTGGAMMAGLAPSGMALTVYPGSTSDSFGFHANSTGGDVYNNGTPTFGGGSVVVAQGSYSRIAIDLTSGKIWMGNASTWKNSGDPAAGTGNVFTFTPGLTLFACLGLNNSGQTCTLRSAVTNIVGTIPSGFSAWE